MWRLTSWSVVLQIWVISMKNDIKVELLAPAGTPDAFYGAIAAGADAVYLAGSKFGARAYADNFDEEALIQAIRYAHLFGVKVYMTVNTLLKNKELEQLAEYIKPYYLAGLDGVIVQDYGVFNYIKNVFPKLELHISTQMTVTSLYGARFLLDNGAKRVVPARELTMSELFELTDEGIEVESFVHGSMCYCYSGQCLFSSILGGRSGNRGRCAQPCRLAYRYKGSNEEYMLSLKDMCTLEYLPHILEGKIASLKIEGRMKNPAYAAGVTAIYRKYIDKYYSNPKQYKVDRKDLELLRHLYIRTEIQDGYYRKERGADMITLQSPAYSKTDETLMDSLYQKYVKNPLKVETQGRVFLRINEPARMTVTAKCKDHIYEVTVEGSVVMEAKNAPLSAEDICTRLQKSGDTSFNLQITHIEKDERIFMPVKALNDLRRDALEALLVKMTYSDRAEADIEAIPVFKKTFSKPYVRFYDSLKVFVETMEQFVSVYEQEKIRNIVVPYYFLEDDLFLQELKTRDNVNIYLKLPAICRSKNLNRIKTLLLKSSMPECVKGFYVNQIDSMAFIKTVITDKEVCGDINLYVMNNFAADTLLKQLNCFTVSVELNSDELKFMNLEHGEIIIYGRYPLMHTANCIFMTHKECSGHKNMQIEFIKDRKGTDFPVKGYCMEENCYNVIYNSLPTSLHRNCDVLEKMNFSGYQIRFVDEKGPFVKEVLHLFDSAFCKHEEVQDFYAYTNGHFKRKVE